MSEGSGITVTSTTMTADEMAQSLVPQADPPAEPTGTDHEPASEDKDQATITVDAEGKERRVSRAQQRVNQVLREKKQAELDAEKRIAEKDSALAEMTKRFDTLEAALRELRSGPTRPEAEPAPTMPPPVDPPKPPVAADADPEPKEDDFSDWTAYNDARAKWNVRQEYRRLDTERQHREATQTAQQRERAQLEQDAKAYVQRAEAAKAEMPDFETVVNRDVKLAPVMGRIMLASEVGPQMAYHFGSHPEDAARIASMPAGLLITEMHRLEGRLLAQRDMKVSPPAAPKLPSAPPPPPLVPAGAQPTVVTSASARTYKEFEEARQRELAANGRRY